MVMFYQCLTIRKSSFCLSKPKKILTYIIKGHFQCGLTVQNMFSGLRLGQRTEKFLNFSDYARRLCLIWLSTAHTDRPIKPHCWWKTPEIGLLTLSSQTENQEFKTWINLNYFSTGFNGKQRLLRNACGSSSLRIDLNNISSNCT